jgi:hypothetical protein
VYTWFDGIIHLSIYMVYLELDECNVVTSSVVP